MSSDLPKAILLTLTLSQNGFQIAYILEVCKMDMEESLHSNKFNCKNFKYADCRVTTYAKYYVIELYLLTINF